MSKNENQALVDKRIYRINQKLGDLSQDDYKAYIKSLPDSASNVEYSTVDFEEKEPKAGDEALTFEID